MEFGMKKCAMFYKKSGKWKMTEGKELLNQQKIRTLGEKETYKFWKWHHQTSGDERKEFFKKVSLKK